MEKRRKNLKNPLIFHFFEVSFFCIRFSKTKNNHTQNTSYPKDFPTRSKHLSFFIKLNVFNYTDFSSFFQLLYFLVECKTWNTFVFIDEKLWEFSHFSEGEKKFFKNLQKSLEFIKKILIVVFALIKHGRIAQLVRAHL